MTRLDQPDPDQTPQPIADVLGHDLIVQWMSGMERGPTLDIPTGRGPLARRLARLGFDVHCADIDRGLFETPELPWTHCNLNDPLPFEDRRFHYVVSVAGLQRVYHPEAVLAEFLRILRPGGRLLLGMWNYGSLRRRLRFLKTGSISGQLDTPGFDQTIADPAANFRNLMIHHRVAHGLRSAGFQIVRFQGVGSGRFRLSHALFWLPLIRLSVLLGGRKLEQRTSARSAARRDMLLGTFHVYEAARPGP